MTPCDPVVHRHFGVMYYLLLQGRRAGQVNDRLDVDSKPSGCFLDVLCPWRWRQYVLVKFRWSTGLDGVAYSLHSPLWESQIHQGLVCFSYDSEMSILVKTFLEWKKDVMYSVRKCDFRVSWTGFGTSDILFSQGTDGMQALTMQHLEQDNRHSRNALISQSCTSFTRMQLLPCCVWRHRRMPSIARLHPCSPQYAGNSFCAVLQSWWCYEHVLCAIFAQILNQ